MKKRYNKLLDEVSEFDIMLQTNKQTNKCHFVFKRGGMLII